MCVFPLLLAHSKRSHIWHNPLSISSVPGPEETEICNDLTPSYKVFSYHRDVKNKIWCYN